MPEEPETGEKSSKRVFVRPSKPIREMSEEELDALAREIWAKTKIPTRPKARPDAPEAPAPPTK